MAIGPGTLSSPLLALPPHLMSQKPQSCQRRIPLSIAMLIESFLPLAGISPAFPRIILSQGFCCHWDHAVVSFTALSIFNANRGRLALAHLYLHAARQRLRCWLCRPTGTPRPGPVSPGSPSSPRRMAKTFAHRISCTSPVSSSMVTNTVPSLPLGCCLATGRPATMTSRPSSMLSTADAGSTSWPSLGLTNSIRWPLGYMPMTLYSPAILSKAVKSASSGAPSSTETRNALCPLLEGLVEGRPAPAVSLRSTRCRTGPALSGWGDCPAPVASHRSACCWRGPALPGWGGCPVPAVSPRSIDCD